MDNIVYFYPEGHQAHAESGHPERPDRVEAIRRSLVEVGWWDGYAKLDPTVLPESILSSIHRPDYLASLQEISRKGLRFDMDTYTTPASWDLALKAAGGAAAVAKAVWNGSAHRGFALTRPPGHHATTSRAMGFCLLNNVALAAEVLLQLEGVRKLAIVDLDLHHGNGTQDIFYNRRDVFFISTHQSPLYPGTGNLDETGRGDGEGTNANFPLPPFSGDRAFRAVNSELILPLLDRYQPEMVMVSFGFDPHWRDPLGNLLLSAGTYGELVRDLAAWADELCQGKIALFLEGGYDLDAAAACSQAVVAALLGQPWEDKLGAAPQSESSAWESMVRKALSIWGL